MAYLKNLTNEASWIIEKHNQKKQKIGIQTFISVTQVKRQLKLKVSAMFFQKLEIIHYMAAIVVYKTEKAFSCFDNKDYTAFIHRLNLLYKLLNTQLFLRQLLDEVYDDIQGRLRFQINVPTLIL